GTFSRQVLALLSGFGVANDNEPCIGIMLQPLRNIVQDRFTGVVDAPRLLLIREVALAQLAGLWRRWRWSFHRHLSCRRVREVTGIRTGCGNSNWSRRGSRRVKCGSVPLPGDAPRTCSPVADRDRHAIRTGAVARDSC